MTISEAISQADALVQEQSFSTNQKVRWISEVEGSTWNELFSDYMDDTDKPALPYSSETLTTELLVPFPYDDLYVLFLASKYLQWQQESSVYNDIASQYNQRREELGYWYRRSHLPKKVNYFGGIL